MCVIVRKTQHVLFSVISLLALSKLGTGLRDDFLSSSSPEFHTCISVDITLKVSTINHATLTLFQNLSFIYLKYSSFHMYRIFMLRLSNT